MKMNPLGCSSHFMLALALAGLSLCIASAAEKQSANATGTWRLSVVTTNTLRPSPQTLKLKSNGSTLTGTLSYNSSPVINGKARTSELPISEGKIQGDLIAFNFSHPPSSGNGPNAAYSYQGKIDGGVIKGTFSMTWMDQTRTREWRAERAKDQ